MRRKFWWKQLVFVLCFTLTAGVVSPVVPVSAEEVQERVAAEVNAEEEQAEQTEESAALTVDDKETTEVVETDAEESQVAEITDTQQGGSVSGNDAVTSTVSDLYETETEQTTVNVTEEKTVSGNDAAGTVSGNDPATESVSDTVESTELTYTDENGNVFSYVLDEEGNATINGISVSGAALIIPEMIDEMPVIAVNNANQCVVTNPEVAIPELTINCNTIGERAFYGTTIGTLSIGEDVRTLIVCNDGEQDYKYYYLQFGAAKIDKVVFRAVELVTGMVTDSETDDFYGPFYQAEVGDLEIGSNVTLIPELLFQGATMELETLELQVDRIGAYAFCSNNISIEHLILGAGVKCFEEFSNSSPIFHHWQQFSTAKIGTLSFHANELDLGHAKENNGTGSLYPPFQGATIGSLEIGDEITRFPEMFICGAGIALEELRITQSAVGAYAFSGMNISIGTLILENTDITFEESYYNTDLFHHFEQFSKTTIGTLKLHTPNLQLEKRLGKTSNSSIYPAFMEATVGYLEIGETVEAIPDYFLGGATLSMEELTINTPVIGAKAFAGGKISFGTLTIGEDVTTFTESYYSQEIFHHWNQFQSCKIGHLIYGATAASVINDVEAIDGTDPDLNGPFQSATIETFTVMENVTCIPDYLLKGATISMEELYLNMPSIGTMAFRGANISIGKLIIDGGVEIFQKSPAGSGTHHYWAQFAYATVGEVHFNVPNLELSKETEGGDFSRGPFYQSHVGQLYLADEVERIPAYCFMGTYLEQEELALHVKSIGTSAFHGSNISIGTLTIGTEVERFESVVSGSLRYFRQFANTRITTLKYLPVNMETGTSCFKGIFQEAVIGNPELDEAVEVIPNYLFYGASMALEEFQLDVPVIGYYSFSSANIKFQKLTVGEGVTTFLANSDNCSRAFDNCTIEQLNYNATAAQMEKLNSAVYGPFSYHTKIKSLVIGDNVEEIPYGCFRDADMTIEELTIEGVAIGYKAFYGSDITIGTLNIGKDVTYKGTVSYAMECFYNTNIGTLNYNSNAVDPKWCTASYGRGMFAYASIGLLNIGEDVETIPALWFYEAEIKQDTLSIPCAWSYRSFDSNDIIVGTLILNGDVQEINHVSNQNFGFSSITADTVIYDIPSAVFTATSSSAYGPFHYAEITNFVLGEHVEYIDSRLLRSCEFTNCYVYPVKASDSYLMQTFITAYLPTTTNLYVHYYSDFRDYFDNEVTEYHWLCVDYFDKTYGDKVYNEETGEYAVEIFKTCSVCGYEEQGTEELDNSYDVYLSIPVEIPLTFDSEEQAYTGSEQVYAYGTLGNAYEGLQIVVEREAENFGKAVMGESTYQISSYLSVGFDDGEAAVFSSEQLSANAVSVDAGEAMPYQEQMQVTVDALAFIEGGAGYYQISIPIRMELQH